MNFWIPKATAREMEMTFTKYSVVLGMEHCQSPDRLGSEVIVSLWTGDTEWSEVAAGLVSQDPRPNKGQNIELVLVTLY